MLLPMLSIYQEYVRNHHYSLQVLTECKQSAPFAALLARLENKPACQGRSLETFLTYPMHQVCASTTTLSIWARITFNSSNFTERISLEKLSNPQVSNNLHRSRYLSFLLSSGSCERIQCAHRSISVPFRSPKEDNLFITSE
jgi:hypothetical protein